MRSEAAAARCRKQGVETLIGDLKGVGAREVERKGVSAIFHLAGIVAPSSRSRTFKVNVEATQEIVAGLAEWQTPPRFIYVSSLSASGPCVDGLPRREADECSPRSIYGESKAAAEAMLKTFAPRLPISIVRPPGVFGPWDRNLLQLYQMVLRGWNLVGVSKRHKYSFVHLTDLVEGMLSVLRDGHSLPGPDDFESQGVYFVADDQPVTFVELANLVASALNVPPPKHITVPTPVCWAVAGLSEIRGHLARRPSFLNRDKMREAVAGSWVCDTTRSQTELGFIAAEPLAERITETAHWYRQQGWLPG